MGFLEKLAGIIGARRGQYSPPRINHQVTADFWTTYLRARGYMDWNVQISAEDVCQMNILQKQSRLACGGYHEDSWLDQMGYSENVSMLDPEQLNKPPERVARAAEDQNAQGVGTVQGREVGVERLLPDRERTGAGAGAAR